MSYIKAVYLDSSQYSDEFIRGIELLEQCSINDSIKYFKRAYESAPDNDQYFSKYKSYYGFSLILSGEEDAIKICRSAVRRNPFDGDICMNLARAENFIKNRLAALNVIETGLQFSSGHDGLQQLKLKLGVRSRKPLPFLSRNNRLSAALGRRMRRKNR